MNAVVFKGPQQVMVEKRPIPQIQDAKDIIVRVLYTGLCGSDLHLFRGYEVCQPGTILGHEFCGTVVARGDDVSAFEEGDLVVSPFTVSCNVCFYCRNGISSRCTEIMVFGTAQLDGAQAQYVRVPWADTTAFKAPSGLSTASLVLMADVFPTGYFAASSGFSKLSPQQIRESTVVVVGCGPVGLCSIIAASSYKPKHLFAIDSVSSRLELARTLGAEPLDLGSGQEEIEKSIKMVTNGRGADLVIELVGLRPALRLGFDLLRTWGILQSVGVHTGDYPWTLVEAYDKNLQIQMGRCPVRSLFAEALELLREKQHLLHFMEANVMPLSAAKEGYDLFNSKMALKVIFDAQK